jgi:hypothetical protein
MRLDESPASRCNPVFGVGAQRFDDLWIAGAVQNHKIYQFLGANIKKQEQNQAAALTLKLL